MFLERIVNPHLPDYPLMPASLWTFSTVFALNLIAVLVVWLLRTGIREHAQVNE